MATKLPHKRSSVENHEMQQEKEKKVYEKETLKSILKGEEAALNFYEIIKMAI